MASVKKKPAKLTPYQKMGRAHRAYIDAVAEYLIWQIEQTKTKATPK